ncbi:hypothetical protein YPPY94_2867, partial [Yersinia pestis PY-94]
MGQP